MTCGSIFLPHLIAIKGWTKHGHQPGGSPVYTSIDRSQKSFWSEEPGKAATCFDATTPNNPWIHVPRSGPMRTNLFTFDSHRHTDRKKTKLSQPGTQLATPGGAIGSVCVQGAAGPYRLAGPARRYRCTIRGTQPPLLTQASIMGWRGDQGDSDPARVVCVRASDANKTQPACRPEKKNRTPSIASSFNYNHSFLAFHDPLGMG
jgi:hypothetical protein